VPSFKSLAWMAAVAAAVVVGLQKYADKKA
jgi:negative regulator of sigma E activity